jgi:ATPase subunit of ABC transporter with duplicated ATPase domains
MIRKDSVLVFDEPTNHLDLESVDALGEAFTLFDGAVFVVTHDQDLASAVATRVFLMEPEKIIDFHGNWAEFVAAYPFDERQHHGRKS